MFEACPGAICHVSELGPPGYQLLRQAKEHGFGMVGTFNTSTSTGSIGYYAKTIADAGLIAFCFAQSPEVGNTHEPTDRDRKVVGMTDLVPPPFLRMRTDGRVEAGTV